MVTVFKLYYCSLHTLTVCSREMMVVLLQLAALDPDITNMRSKYLVGGWGVPRGSADDGIQNVQEGAHPTSPSGISHGLKKIPQ